MLRVKSRYASRPLAFAVVLMVAACLQDDPAGPQSGEEAATRITATFSATTLPDSLIFEDEPMLAVARAVPTFAGFYYNDNGEVEVLMTSSADMARAEMHIRPYLGAHRASAARLVQRAATYTFLELARYRTVLRQEVFDIPGVVSLGVRESANRVKVGVEHGAAEASVRMLMTAVGVPQGAVMFVSESRGRDLVLRNRTPTSASRPFLLTVQHQHPNGLIQGGWEITNSGGWTCTLGFPALRASDHLPVFVTNSHCTAVRTAYDASTFTQPFGPQIGQEILDPPDYVCGYPGFEDDCRNSDSAMIRADTTIDLGRIARTTEPSDVGCEHCSAPLTIDSAEPTFVIGATIANVFENETLNKVGRTTGWTRGKVEDTCDDFESGIAGQNDPWVKQCSDRVDFSINPGDSGSPVFSFAANGTVELRGLVFGEQTCCAGYYDAWMTDLNQIGKDLGPLIIYDPGPPVVTISGPTQVPPDVWCSWDAVVNNGVPPFTYEWSGMFTGGGQTIQGFVQSPGGDLYVEVTDVFGRQAIDAITVTADGEPGPFMCE